MKPSPLRMSDQHPQPINQRVVRVGALETRLQNFRGEMGFKLNAAIKIYDGMVVVPLLNRMEALDAPWFVRLWYHYLRPILELYGLQPLPSMAIPAPNVGVPPVPQVVVDSEEPEPEAPSLIVAP